MNNNLDSYVHKGVPIDCCIRIKPEPYQRKDLRVYENKISLLDQYDRGRLLLIVAVDEFVTNGQILEHADAFRTSFDSIFRKYVHAVLQGINFTLFTFGAKSSGKSYALEGSNTESGIYSLLVENIFNLLENKRNAILEEISNLNSNELEATSFTYNVRMKFVELKDESPTDLLQKYNYYKQPIQIVTFNNIELS
jgi:hypothetical protein